MAAPLARLAWTYICERRHAQLAMFSTESHPTPLQVTMRQATLQDTAQAALQIMLQAPSLAIPALDLGSDTAATLKPYLSALETAKHKLAKHTRLRNPARSFRRKASPQRYICDEMIRAARRCARHLRQAREEELQQQSREWRGWRRPGRQQAVKIGVSYSYRARLI